MNNLEELIICLDVFVFGILIGFFVIILKSNSLFKDNQKDGRFLSCENLKVNNNKRP